MDEFGDEAANTVVYSYIFRLAGQAEEGGGGENGNGREEQSSAAVPTTRISRPKSVASSHQSAEPTQKSPPLSRNESSPPARREGETEAARLMRELIRNGNHPEVSWVASDSSSKS